MGRSIPIPSTARNSKTLDNVENFIKNSPVSLQTLDDFLFQSSVSSSLPVGDLDLLAGYLKRDVALQRWGKEQAELIFIATDRQLLKALEYFPKAKELISAK